MDNNNTMEYRIGLEKQNKRNDQVTELILDNCRASQISGLTEEFINLETLSLINIGLTTLKGFPKLPKLKKLELSDNRLAGGLNLLHGSPNLQHLNISGNRIKDFEALEPLKELKHLYSLDLYNCEVTSASDYRKKVFELLPNLQALDGYDKNQVEVSSDDEIDDDDDEDEEESDVENRISRNGNGGKNADVIDDSDEGADDEEGSDDGDYNDEDDEDIENEDYDDDIGDDEEEEVGLNSSGDPSANAQPDDGDCDDDVQEITGEDGEEDEEDEDDEEDGADLSELQKDGIVDESDDEDFEPTHEPDERDHEIDPEDDIDEDADVSTSKLDNSMNSEAATDNANLSRGTKRKFEDDAEAGGDE